MRIIKTHEVEPDSLTQWERDQVYNGLDCCVTAEVLDELLPQLDPYTSATYTFSRELQAPVLEMRLRGVRIDKQRRAEVVDELFTRADALEQNLERMVFEGCGLPSFNWRSNADLQLLFYERLGIPVIRKAGRPTVNREALERMEQYLVAKPIVLHMKALRDLHKKISVLKTEIDLDGRMRTSYNIAGTNTGRFSSSFSEFGTGGNLQNVEESLRSIFIADKGMKLAKFDAKSGESFIVGALEWNLFHDGRYLDVCESGDPHTAVARIMWPEIAWTGDLDKDRRLASQKYYRHYTYRFMCKKLGHGSNYGGRPDTLSEQSRIPLNLVAEFQPKYFRAFPAHLRWQESVKREIYRSGTIISLLGRKRHFWGRRNDEKVHREAIAYNPQSSLADIVNHSMLNIWRKRIAQLYMQDHDALTFQYPEETEDEIIPLLFEALKYPVELADGRALTIPYDCVVGWNRGKYDPKKNPDGLKDYVPGDKRTRSPEVPILDRIIH